MGEKSVLFGLLSLIRSDPSFGSGQTTGLFEVYKAPDITMTDEKLSGIIPMLYAARFEPNITLRELVRSLWDKLIPVGTSKVIVSAHLEVIIKYLSSKVRFHVLALLEVSLFSPSIRCVVHCGGKGTQLVSHWNL